MMSKHPPETPRRSALDWPAERGLAQTLAEELAGRARRRQQRRRVWAAVVAVVLLGGVGAWSTLSRERRPVAEPGRIVTHEPRRQLLPDGTTVDLRDDAIIEADYSGEFRRVTLRGGEAHFQVAKDPRRPFVVSADGAEVRAVGTAFSVLLLPAARIEVLVTEGKVALAEPNAPVTAGGKPVVAGELAVVSRDRAESAAAAQRVTISRPLSAEIAERQSWRVLRLEFSATPLAEAIARLNRHSAEPLQLADESLADLRISGIVRGDNSAALVRLLVANYDVAVERGPDGSVRLHRR